MDPFPVGLLPTCQGSVAPVSWLVPALSRSRVHRRATPFLLYASTPCGTVRVPQPSRTCLGRRMGHRCQAAIRRAASGLHLYRRIYPSHRHLEQPAHDGRRWQGQLSMEGLSTWKPPRRHDTDGRRIYPALPDSCAAGRLSPHPVLRIPRQLPSSAQARALPGTFGDGTGRTGRRSGTRRPCGPSATPPRPPSRSAPWLACCPRPSPAPGARAPGCWRNWSGSASSSPASAPR